IAQFISIVLHPLLMMTYMLVLLMLINPYLFGVHKVSSNVPFILYIFFSTFLLPAFAAFLMKQLDFIKSIHMEDKMERIGPYIITGTIYLWMFRSFLDNPQIPSAYTMFILGSTIGLFIAFFINIFSKISAHAVGMGGLLGMVVISLYQFSYGDFIVNLSSLGVYKWTMNGVLMTTIVLAGLVGTSRLLLNAHEPKDLYGGYLVGFAAQFVALWFMG
ncbi:MAG: hypothetical protein AAF705_18470, partial [Bacteroidota bacterium]